MLRLFKLLAEWTGLEPATPGVTGRYSNRLNYHSAFFFYARLNIVTCSRSSHQLGAWQCPTLTWRMPHYHRRYNVSLLCSAWVQVVPSRYCRQAYSVPLSLLLTIFSNKSWKAVQLSLVSLIISSSIKQALQNYLGVVWLSLSGH